MVAILQTTFSSLFSWNYIIIFWSKVHWGLFLKVNLIILALVQIMVWHLSGLTLLSSLGLLMTSPPRVLGHLQTQWWLWSRSVYISGSSRSTINLLHVEFIWGYIKIICIVLCLSYLDPEMVGPWVVEILTHGKEDLPRKYGQYHSCWCSADGRILVISSHNISSQWMKV